jgi:predicted transcriptional regulator
VGVRINRPLSGQPTLYAPMSSCYESRMAKSKKFDLENSAPVIDDEDEETLAAIDEGIRDAEAGRTVPAEEVRRLLPKWTTASSTRKGR